MLQFIFKRLLMVLPVLIGVTFTIFSLMYFAPGDPAEIILGDLATQEDKDLFREQNGLNDPFFVQYLSYMKGIVTRGDLGTSYVTKQPVTTELLQRFPTTCKLATLSIIVAIFIGVSAGIISAIRQYSILDNLSRIVSMIGVSMPNFWLGMMLIIFFAVTFKWLPASGFSSPRHWILPAVTIGVNVAANIMRMTRSSMLEVVRQDYIRTARARGESEWVVICSHALKNALIPIITIVGLSFGRLLGGSIMAESVFSIAGLGKLMVDSIKAKNTPVIQGGVLFIAFVMVLLNLVVDVLYAYADPRIRSQYARPKPQKTVPEKEAVNAN